MDTAVQAKTATGDQLGELLFVYTANSRRQAILMILLPPLIPFMLWVGGRVAGTDALDTVSVLFCAVAVIAAFAGVVVLSKGLFGSICVHKHGVRMELQRQRGVLLYKDVDAIMYGGVTYYGLHTTMSAMLRAQDGSTCWFSAALRGKANSDTPETRSQKLDMVAQTVIGHIKSRMIESLKKGDSVPWIRELRLRRDGVVHRNGTFYPWAALGQFNINNAVYYLSVRGPMTKLVASGGTAQMNFWPGHAIVKMMMEQAAKQAKK